jgi:hypothetical protein
MRTGKVSLHPHVAKRRRRNAFYSATRGTAAAQIIVNSATTSTRENQLIYSEICRFNGRNTEARIAAMAATGRHRICSSVGATNADWNRDFAKLRLNSGLVWAVTPADLVL